MFETFPDMPYAPRERFVRVVFDSDDEMESLQSWECLGKGKADRLFQREMLKLDPFQRDVFVQA